MAGKCALYLIRLFQAGQSFFPQRSLMMMISLNPNLSAGAVLMMSFFSCI